MNFFFHFFFFHICMDQRIVYYIILLLFFLSLFLHMKFSTSLSSSLYFTFSILLWRCYSCCSSYTYYVFLYLDCNRTYYAAMGENYRLMVTWPKMNQMPFICYLTFASATHDPTELLQVTYQLKMKFKKKIKLTMIQLTF